MHILTVGLNYKKTPVHIRERFSLPGDRLPDALRQLRKTKSILECMIISTCNRTEVYAVVDQLHTGRYYIKMFLAQWFKIEKEAFEPYLEMKENDQALQHLFEVPVGLDSMVLGETQILGQVKSAFFTAQEASTTGTIFNTLFQKVIANAKKAHAETEIGQNAVSVSYAAIELGKKIFGDLKGKKVLILGAGKMSELTVKHLNANGVTDVYVVNRTYERALELANKFNGQAIELSGLEQRLSKIDIVISSTGSSGYVMTKDTIQSIMAARHHQPLFLIDIAVPRDLDPDIHHVENAFLYDIDDLNGIVNANIEERRKEAEKIRQMIAHEMKEFRIWVNTLGVVPVISALRQKALSIQEETMQSILNKCPDLDEREIRVIRKHTKSIVNQLLRDPITRVKELSAEPGAKESLELFTEIFALEENIKEQEKVDQAQQLAKRMDNKKKTYQDQAVKKELPVQ